VHPRGRPRLARCDRADGTLSQHPRASARVRTHLCIRVRHQRRAVLVADPALGCDRRRPRDRDRTDLRNHLAGARGPAPARIQRSRWGPTHVASETTVHGTIEQVFRVEWRPVAGLAAIADDWRALAASALAPNVFYEPAFALAAQPVFGRDAGAGLVWSRATPPRLLGLFPARIERRRYGVPLPVLVGWTHPYAPLGTPLVDRAAAEPVIGAWLDHLAGRRAPLPQVMLLPLFPAEGRLARAFDTVLKGPHGRAVSFASHQRALLAPAEDRAGYLEDALGAKKLKELRRQLRRLGDGGVVTTTITREPAAIAAALDDFLALEAAGWKGRAGTAARDRADIRAFLTGAGGAPARRRQ